MDDFYHQALGVSVQCNERSIYPPFLMSRTRLIECFSMVTSRQRERCRLIVKSGV